jgi:hypothetical protein
MRIRAISAQDTTELVPPLLFLVILRVLCGSFLTIILKTNSSFATMRAGTALTYNRPRRGPGPAHRLLHRGHEEDCA